MHSGKQRKAECIMTSHLMDTIAWLLKPYICLRTLIYIELYDGTSNMKLLLYDGTNL